MVLCMSTYAPRHLCPYCTIVIQCIIWCRFPLLASLKYRSLSMLCANKVHLCVVTTKSLICFRCFSLCRASYAVRFHNLGEPFFQYIWIHKQLSWFVHKKWYIYIYIYISFYIYMWIRDDGNKRSIQKESNANRDKFWFLGFYVRQYKGDFEVNDQLYYKSNCKIFYGVNCFS